MTTTMIEYYWNGSTWVQGATFDFTPSPSSIEKEVKCGWRIRHRGLKTDHKRAVWRYRKTEVYKLRGILETEDKRQKLEALATRNAKFKLVTDMKSLATDTVEIGSKYPPQVEDAYFTITELRFTSPTGQTVYQYDLTMERVVPP